MKKTVLAGILLLAMILPAYLQAQFSITPSASSFCYASGGNTANASVNLTPPGTTSFTWSIASPLGNSALFTTLPPAPGMPSNISTTLTGCGIYTITCIAYNGASPTITATQTVNVNCLVVTTTNMGVCLGNTATLTAFGASSYSWTGTGILQPVVQASISVGAGSYTVSSTFGSDICTAVMPISQSPPLNVLVSQSSGTTCITSNMPNFSKPVVLNASGGSTYSWSPAPPSPLPPTASTITVRPLVTTCYTVVAFTSICSGTAVACVSVTPQFSVNAAATPSTFICRYDSVIVGVTNVGQPAAGPSSSFTYSWNVSPSPVGLTSVLSPTVMFYPLFYTTYTVEVTDALNCISVPFQGVVYVTPCVAGLNEIGAGAETDLFTLYPNPVKDWLRIQPVSGHMEGVQIEVLDMAGRRVLQQQPGYQAQDPSYGIDLKELGAGVYLLTIRNQQQVLQRSKLVKE